jgi:hypothetical protein
MHKVLNFVQKKAPNLLEGLILLAVWTGLELFLKTPGIKGLPRGRFWGAPQGSPFNISLTLVYHSKLLP